MAKSQGIQKRHLEDLKLQVDFESIGDLAEDIEDHFGGPAFFVWNGREFVIDGFRAWRFERFDEDAGLWDPLTPEFETADELFDLPCLDGKSLRDRFDECRFFVE